MTDKEKAKAYDEALERASKIKNGEDNWRFCDLTEIIPALEEVFPALSESEDERIRKVIYKLMLGMREEIFTSQDEIVTKEKALAYLEKKPDIKIWPYPIKDAYLEQKESLHIPEMCKENPDSFTDEDEQKEPHYTKRNALFDKCVENCDPKVMKEVSDKVDAMLEKEQKQVENPKKGCPTYPLSVVGDLLAKTPQEPIEFVPEQKPAEWSEEDKKMLEDIIDVIQIANAHGYRTDDSAIKEEDWLKSLRPQPKQVWTEEDDRICHLIMTNLSESARHAITLPMETVNDFNNWLRTLQCMPPVFTDWNEEDQTLLSDALGCVTMVQELKKRGKLKDFHISCSYDELRSWVRSLKSRPRKQPHWKPSEEQMEVLLNAEGMVRANNYPENAKILAALYEQLKKLM